LPVFCRTVATWQRPLSPQAGRDALPRKGVAGYSIGMARHRDRESFATDNPVVTGPRFRIV